MTKPKSICTECSHFGDPDREAVRPHVECLASPNPTAIDPVSGKELPYADNDFGRRYFGATAYKLCRDVNTGDCPRFNEAKD